MDGSLTHGNLSSSYIFFSMCSENIIRKPILLIQDTVATSSHCTEVKPKISGKQTPGIHTHTVVRLLLSTHEWIVLLYICCIIILVYIPMGI